MLLDEMGQPSFSQEGLFAKPNDEHLLNAIPCISADLDVHAVNPLNASTGFRAENLRAATRRPNSRVGSLGPLWRVVALSSRERAGLAAGAAATRCASCGVFIML